MNVIRQSHSGSKVVAIALEPSPSTHGVNEVMTRCLDWAEDHWEAVAIMVSLLCAVSLAALLAVTFNVVSTKLDRVDHGSVAAPTASLERPARINRPTLDSAF